MQARFTHADDLSGNARTRHHKESISMQFSICFHPRGTIKASFKRFIHMANMIEILSPSEALTFEKRLGSGGFGSVYLGTFRDRPAAVKKLNVKPKTPKQ